MHNNEEYKRFYCSQGLCISNRINNNLLLSSETLILSTKSIDRASFHYSNISKANPIKLINCNFLALFLIACARETIFHSFGFGQFFPNYIAPLLMLLRYNP
uniref:Uncharacterized protein n=1 Tax=Glossina pallidipes TaxID=7398 RepID=A0A1A9ZUB0_GLOPL